MNFIFLSPNYPENYWNFCDRLKKNGVNVLGVGDAPYENLSQNLRDSLTEYYRVDSLDNYDELYKATAFLSYKYGKPDWIESMNPYWLSQEIRLHEDFNIPNGLKCLPAQAYDDETLAKNQNAEGLLCSYDAISDSNGDPLFESMTVWPENDTSPDHKDVGILYYTCPGMPAKLRSLGRKTLKSLKAGSRFVYFAFIRLTKDQEGFGREGDYIPIDTDICPAGGYIPDMMNFAHSVDVYKIWADMITTDRRYMDDRLQAASELGHHTSENEEDCFSVHASRKDGIAYVHPESRIADKYHDVIMMRKELPESAWKHLGRYIYTLRLRSQHEVDTFVKYLHETKPEEKL